MSGKAYTLKEMKIIVEYITQRKAYGEVKGRKMWVDFANSQLTVRTWQSLKETFLKRILPDIHNPYYRLTVDQIRSFKEGCDVAEKEKNKLQIVNLDDDSNSNSNAENQGDITQPSTSHANKGDATSGEEVTNSKVQNRDRDSVDTVIIPTCYETAEDVQRALESPKSNVENHEAQTKSNTTPTKSLRDLITYSEPLTPMLQEVLHDFATDGDSDSDEMRMHIVEEVVQDSEPQTANKEFPILVQDSESQVNEPIEILDSEDVANKNETVQEDAAEESDFVQPKILSLKLKKRKAGNKSDKKSEKTPKKKSDEINSTGAIDSAVPNESKENNMSEIGNTNDNANANEVTKPSTDSQKATPHLSNITDTILPNNQEALENSRKTYTNSAEHCESELLKPKEVKKTNEAKSKTRKRATSQDVTTSAKIKKNLIKDPQTKLKEKAVSDTDTIKKKLKAFKSENSKPNFVNKPNQIKSPSHKSDDNAQNIVLESNIDTENKSSTNNMDSNTNEDLSQLNPCLKSVSLYAEQFNTVSYIDSESEHEAEMSGNKHEGKMKSEKGKKTIKDNKKKIDEHNNKTDAKKDKKTMNKNKQTDDTPENTLNEVVILKSHSESESENHHLSPKKTNAPDSRVSKSQREKALANVFGFSSGAAGMKRKRRVSYRKNSTYRYPRNDTSGESSEWTSESDSEAYVSPPRGRRNKQTRKYLKPHSARILSLEEEGGLFVMYGKKIYPLVKDGKIIKNYLTYLPESDPEEEESYWKFKYVEERNRLEELKKLVNQQNLMKTNREKSPILPGKSLGSKAACHDHRSPAKSVNNRILDQEPLPAPFKESNEEVHDSRKTLKITFAKNNQEVHVEGHWSNIHPVLAEVVQIFNKDSTPELAKSIASNRSGVSSKQLSESGSEKSVMIVPIIDEVTHDKVNQLETEIFKEIEKRDQEEQQVELKEPSETNVTKRKRAPRSKTSLSNQSAERKSSTSSPRSSKRQKISDTKENDDTEKENPTTEQKPVEEKPAESEQKSVGKKVSKTAKKTVGKKANTTQKKGQQKEDKTTNTVEQEVEENSKDNISVEAANSTSSVRTRRQNKTPKKDKEAVTPKSNAKSPRKSKVAEPSPQDDDEEVRYMFPPATRLAKTSRTSLSKAKENMRYLSETPKIYCSPNLSLHSESTQGYQDSDISPPKAAPKRKRKLSLTTALTKIRHRSHRSMRKSYPIVTADISSDSNSSYHIIVRPTDGNRSLNSEAYRSDSYQLLFPKNKSIFKPLEKIDEDSPVLNMKEVEKSLKTSANLEALRKSLDNMNNNCISSSNGNTDGGHSSNVSLPLSPELSIVENLSISKELLNSVQCRANLNNIEESQMISDTRNKYLMSQVDVSMPLMEQDCNFCPSFHNIIETEDSFDEVKPPAISDSLLNKINTVNIEEAPSLSESLDTRLKNLLLESAKKMSVANEYNIKEEPKDVKTKSSKRCSTPRKRQGVQKKKRKITEPVVEEEYTESCSHGGRNSCPPVIQLITAGGILNQENVEVNSDKDVLVNEKSKGRKKKDIIKVKILRPRSKTRKETPDNTCTHNDSGINETESIISNQGFNDSVDLIHNHSETCLHANECLAGSVEFVETTSRSIISLTTDSLSVTDQSLKDQAVFRDCEELVPEFFCSNAQDWANVNAREPTKTTDNTSETVYHSPMVSDSSLITEDLSDDRPLSQQTKWYLLSEDETQIANLAMNPSSGFGANLKQIFPITCAVPDLSTITEMSNDNSRIPTLESDSTRQDFDSQDMFDNMKSN